jgi:hypothetical protein
VKSWRLRAGPGRAASYPLSPAAAHASEAARRYINLLFIYLLSRFGGATYSNLYSPLYLFIGEKSELSIVVQASDSRLAGRRHVNNNVVILKSQRRSVSHLIYLIIHQLSKEGMMMTLLPMLLLPLFKRHARLLMI